jgi:hypothetical protein
MFSFLLFLHVHLFSSCDAMFIFHYHFGLNNVLSNFCCLQLNITLKKSSINSHVYILAFLFSTFVAVSTVLGVLNT